MATGNRGRLHPPIRERTQRNIQEAKQEISLAAHLFIKFYSLVLLKELLGPSRSGPPSPQTRSPSAYMSFEAQPIELPPFEIARLVVRLDPVASVIVNANQEIL